MARVSVFALCAGLLATLSVAPPALAHAGEGRASSVPAGDLHGVVYDGTGMPLIGALINVLVPGLGKRSAAVTLTDERGQFAVESLPEGEYTVLARSVGFIQAAVPGVRIPRAEPLSMQLRQESSMALLTARVTTDLGWVFRPPARDVLRQREGVRGVMDSPQEVETTFGDWLAATAHSLGFDDMGGELSLWTVDPFPADGGGNSVTDVALGANRNRQNWVLRANVADGGLVRARSEVTQPMGDDHLMKFGLGYAGKNIGLPGVNEDADRMWVGSLAAEDHWRLGDSVQLSYGLRFEHYNFLEDGDLVSPRVELAWAPVESLVLTTGVAYDAEAPGLAELRFEIDPSTVRYIDILTPEGIEPERSLRTTVGVRRETGASRFQAQAFHVSSSDELVGLLTFDRAGPSDYTVLNAGDASTRGFEVDVQRTILEDLAGEVSYSYSRRSGALTTAEAAVRRGLVDAGIYSDDADADESFHEVEAALETVVGTWDTQVRAIYSWKRGVPVVRDGELGEVYDRLDVRVRQPLPFRLLATEWSALVQVHNVLGQEYDGVFDLSLRELPMLSRLVAGGLAVRF